MSATGPSTTPDHVRKAWNEAHVSPLWEQLEAHSTEVKRDRAYIWKWSTMKPLIDNALALQDMAAIQRRVLTFNNPNLRNPGMGATPTLTAALQILKPGEVARPHRHSPSALRFVLEGDGAYTIVDGKECLMNEGDLVITPGWTWHAHEHRGTRPIIWLDSLDVPLHRYFGTDGFEPVRRRTRCRRPRPTRCSPSRASCRTASRPTRISRRSSAIPGSRRSPR